MNLEDLIRQSIYEYPLLYRVKNDPVASRMLVLNHLFLVNGNGFDWSKDGTLVEIGTKMKGRKTLPARFFKINLFSFKLTTDHITKTRDFLKSQNRFHYTFKYKDEARVYLEAESASEALRIAQKFKPEVSAFLVTTEQVTSDYSPYPICQYSAIAELIEGRTHTLMRDGFNFEDYPPQKSWIDGCRDIALEALSYYHTPERQLSNSYHPKHSSIRFRRDYDAAKKNGDLDVYLSEHQYELNETPEEKAVRTFEEFKAEQIDYLESFLKKYPVTT